MVCIPCIVAPVLLFVWYRFLQPLMLKFWNPWSPKTVKSQPENKDPLADLKCPFVGETEVLPTAIPETQEESTVIASDKKND